VAGRARDDRRILLLDLVDALAGSILSGFDFEPALLGGSGEESPNRMSLPRRCFHDLCESGALGEADHFQDFCAFALGAWSAGLGAGFGGVFAGLGFFLGRGGLGFGTLGGFLALGRTLLLAGAFLCGSLTELEAPGS